MSTDSCSVENNTEQLNKTINRIRREKTRRAITFACVAGLYVGLAALACWAEAKDPGCLGRYEKEQAKREYERRLAEIDRKWGYR